MFQGTKVSPTEGGSLKTVLNRRTNGQVIDLAYAGDIESDLSVIIACNMLLNSKCLFIFIIQFVNTLFTSVVYIEHQHHVSPHMLSLRRPHK